MLERYAEGDSFKKRVARCEKLAAEKPEAYRRRVALMAWLGYWTLPVLLVLATLPVIYIVWLMVEESYSPTRMVVYGGIWGLYVLALMDTARVLFASPEPLDGYELSPLDAPELFQLIEEVQTKLDAPALDRVILNDEMNAAAAQVSKSAFLGRTTNELLIGLPLLCALNRDEFASVIAHEFGHFSGEHGRHGFLVARTLRAWEIVLGTTEDFLHPGNVLALGIAKWFVPRFLAYSFAMRRDDEFLADKAAAKATNAETAARSLIRVELVEHFASENVKSYWHRALALTRVPNEPLNEIYAKLGKASESPLAEGLLQIALFDNSDPSDTHPILNARLKALGVAPSLPVAVSNPAVRLLGPFAVQAFAHFNARFVKELAIEWRQQRQEYLSQKRRFEEIEEKAKQGKLSLDEALERAQLARFSGGERFEDASIRLFSEVVCLYPGEARAMFGMGAALIDQFDDRAAEFLQQAAKFDEMATGGVLSYLAAMAAWKGDSETAKAYLEQSKAWYEDNEERIAKLHDLLPGGPLKPCVPQSPNAYKLALDDVSNMIERAYLVTKPMPEWFDEQVFLVVEPRFYIRMYSDNEICQSIAEAAMAAGLEPTFRIWPLSRGEDWLRQQLAELPKAQIWSRNGKFDDVPTKRELASAEAA